MCPRIDKKKQQQISWKMFYWFVLYVSITKLTKIFKHFSTWVTMDMISINFHSISDTMCLNHRLDIPQCWDVNIFISIHNTFALSNVSHPMQNLYKICERNSSSYHIQLPWNLGKPEICQKYCTLEYNFL